jgi:hypothetical protein
MDCQAIAGQIITVKNMIQKIDISSQTALALTQKGD